jgi:molybdenum cofactor guanylyltransferase
MIADCTAIVMAGGTSRRMGTDKASLLLNGQTLLQSVVAAMQQIFPGVIISVRQPRLAVDLPQICDTETDGGPLAGLIASLEKIETPWAFAVACDMPFITPALVELLAGYRAPPYQAIVPMVQGHPQPLAAFYAKDCLQVMRSRMSAQQKSLRGVLQQLQVRYVDEAELVDMRSFFDLDTPQDFAAALNGVK